MNSSRQDERPSRDGAAVRIAGLRKSFGTVHAVRGVDLEIAPGEVVAFLGPNGAGKSTTIDMLLGLTKPDSGHASIFGDPPIAAVQAGRVGAMLQGGGLLPEVRVRELVTMFAALHRSPMPVKVAMERAGIADIGGQKTQKLSGGQTQRVRYALALVPDPDLMILDEPTVAMDVEVRRSFWASMREFAEAGRTVLFATHYLEEADAFADRVVVLANGVIVADGTGAQIKQSVAGRTLSAVIAGAGPEQLRQLPGVVSVDQEANRILLHCDDSDRALRALLDRFPNAHDIEIAAGNLEDAFLELTGSVHQETTKTHQETTR